MFRGALNIVERQSNTVDFLIRFMPFACNEHGIAHIRLGDRESNRGSAVGFNHGRAGLTATQNVANDCLGRLGTGIIAGHDDTVGKSTGNRAHFGALATVPVAATTEQYP